MVGEFGGLHDRAESKWRNVSGADRRQPLLPPPFGKKKKAFWMLSIWYWWYHRMFLGNHLLKLELNSFMNSTVILCHPLLKIKQLIYLFLVVAGRVFLGVLPGKNFRF